MCAKRERSIATSTADPADSIAFVAGEVGWVSTSCDTHAIDATRPTTRGARASCRDAVTDGACAEGLRFAEEAIDVECRRSNVIALAATTTA